MFLCIFIFFFAQHVVLSATLRRIGEEVFRPAAQATLLQSEDAHLPRSCGEAAGSLRSWHLYRSPCPHTRILSALIALRTVTQGIITEHMWIDFIWKMQTGCGFEGFLDIGLIFLSLWVTTACIHRLTVSGVFIAY